LSAAFIYCAMSPFAWVAVTMFQDHVALPFRTIAVAVARCFRLRLPPVVFFVLPRWRPLASCCHVLLLLFARHIFDLLRDTFFIYHNTAPSLKKDISTTTYHLIIYLSPIVLLWCLRYLILYIKIRCADTWFWRYVTSSHSCLLLRVCCHMSYGAIAVVFPLLLCLSRLFLPLPARARYCFSVPLMLLAAAWRLRARRCPPHTPCLVSLLPYFLRERFCLRHILLFCPLASSRFAPLFSMRLRIYITEEWWCFDILEMMSICFEIFSTYDIYMLFTILPRAIYDKRYAAAISLSLPRLFLRFATLPFVSTRFCSPFHGRLLSAFAVALPP